MNQIKRYGKTIIKNAIPFLINLLFVFFFGALFGSENTLLAVAIGVGLTMLPLCPLNWNPTTTIFIILTLYVGSSAVGQFALLSPYLAFPVNFLFVLIILLLTSEPNEMKPSISFLLCFVFCQSTCVEWSLFPTRLFGSLVGSFLVIGVCFLFWYHKGNQKEGRSITEQISLCNHHHRYLFRMAFGIAFAMFFGMIFHLKKPLWISIVVMSLTQVDWEETRSRIHHRFLGTLLGMIVFFVFFQLWIPQEYAMYFIILLGYLSSFTNEYKYKQVVNAVSALTASLVLLDTKEALLDRIVLFLLGAIIVVMIYQMAEAIKKGKEAMIHWISKKGERYGTCNNHG